MMDEIFALKSEWKPGDEVRVFLSKKKHWLEDFELEFHELKQFEITEGAGKWKMEDFKTVDENFKPTLRTYYYVDETENGLKIVDHVHGAQYIEKMIERND